MSQIVLDREWPDRLKKLIAEIKIEIIDEARKVMLEQKVAKNSEFPQLLANMLVIASGVAKEILNINNNVADFLEKKENEIKSQRGVG